MKSHRGSSFSGTFWVPNKCPTRVHLWAVHAGTVKQPSSGSESTSTVAENTVASQLMVYCTKYNPPKKVNVVIKLALINI